MDWIWSLIVGGLWKPIAAAVGALGLGIGAWTAGKRSAERKLDEHALQAHRDREALERDLRRTPDAELDAKLRRYTRR